MFEKKNQEVESPSQDLSHGNPSVPEEELPHGLRLVIIFAALVCSILLVALDSTIIATAIPHITDEFHSLDQVGWYGSAYFLTNAAFQSLWGKAYTYYDLKSVFNVGIGLFEIGTLICALSQNSTTFIAGRAVAGFGGAALGSGAFTIVAAISTPRKRAMYIGFMGATYGVASVIGPVIGGAFTQYLTWRWCFWINLPIGALASIIVLFFFRAPYREAPALTMVEKLQHMDFLGAIPLLACLVCFLLPMRWGGVSFAWDSAPVIGTLVAFVALAMIFVYLQWRGQDKAMVQVRFFENSEIVVNLFYMFFLSGLYMPAVYFISIQFQALENRTPARAGLELIPLALTVSVGTIVANTSISRGGHPGYWLVTGPVCAITGATLIYVLGANASTEQWIGFQILLGFGIGFALQTPMSINQSLVDARDIPTIIAITLFFEEMGACMLISVCEAAFSNRLVESLEKSPTQIEPLSVVQAGAGQLRSLFPPQDLPDILDAYQLGLDLTYLVSLTCGGVALLLSLLVILLDHRQSRHRNTVLDQGGEKHS